MTSPPQRQVAAFDFDGTLTRRDSLFPFLVEVAGWPAVAKAFAAQGSEFAAIALKRGDRDATKDRFLRRVLAGRSHDELVAAGTKYGAHLAADKVTPDMRERVAWHHREGHDVVIVSASLDLYLSEVARQLEATLLCTRLEASSDGVCTGVMIGGNCRGIGKETRLRDYLGDEPVELWAYGDSSGDTEMLAIADHPVKVKRGRLPRDNRQPA